MDDPSVDEHLLGDPSSSVLSDRLLSDQEALTESRSYTRLMDADLRTRLQLRRQTPSRTISNKSTENGSSVWDIRNLEYATEVDDNLMCPICHSPFVSPAALKCQHIFCRQCLSEALSHQQDSKTCPTCRRPTSTNSMVTLPKVVCRMLEELRVKCPLAFKGCNEIIPRGSVQTHLDRYCGYEEVLCPSEDCDQYLPRRLAGKECLHEPLPCPDCTEEVSLLNLDNHRMGSCKVAEIICTDCSSSVQKSIYKDHVSSCMETVIKCTASEYGCDSIGKRSIMQEHIESCALAKLAPTLALQNARLEEHARALKHLQQKNAVHEAFLDTVKDTLATIASTDLTTSSLPSDSVAPFDSPLSHLLSLHEALREEVSRVSAAVSDLDAKTDTAFLNSSLRAKEEAAHRDAVLTQLRVQLQWLVSSRLQGIHTAKAGTGALSISDTRRDSNNADSSSNRLFSSTRRGSDGLGNGGREKL